MNLVCVNLIFFALCIGSVRGADPKWPKWDANSFDQDSFEAAMPKILVNESAAREVILRRQHAADRDKIEAAAPRVTAASDASSFSKSSDSARRHEDLSGTFASPQSRSRSSSIANAVAAPPGKVNEESAAFKDVLQRWQQSEETYDTAARDVPASEWVREWSSDDGGDVDAWLSMHKLLKRNHQLRGDLLEPVPMPPVRHQSLPSSANGSDSKIVPDVRSAGLVGDLLGDSTEPLPQSKDTDASTFGFLRSTVPSNVIDALSAFNGVAKSYQSTGQTLLVPVDQTVHYGTAYH